MDFLNNYGETIFIIIFTIAMVLSIRHVNLKKNQKIKIVKQLKSGSISSKEIIGKIIAIEYGLEVGSYEDQPNPNYINRWYFIAEGENPFTHQNTKYKSEEYNYDGPISRKFSLRLTGASKDDKELFKQHISNYIKIGDRVKIAVSTENPNDYYIEDIKKGKNTPYINPSDTVIQTFDANKMLLGTSGTILGTIGITGLCLYFFNPKYLIGPQEIQEGITALYIILGLSILFLIISAILLYKFFKLLYKEKK